MYNSTELRLINYPSAAGATCVVLKIVILYSFFSFSHGLYR